MSISKHCYKDEIMNLCICSFKNCLSNPHYVPETVLGSWVTLMNKTDNSGRDNNNNNNNNTANKLMIKYVKR